MTHLPTALVNYTLGFLSYAELARVKGTRRSFNITPEKWIQNNGVLSIDVLQRWVKKKKDVLWADAATKVVSRVARHLKKLDLTYKIQLTHGLAYWGTLSLTSRVFLGEEVCPQLYELKLGELGISKLLQNRERRASGASCLDILKKITLGCPNVRRLIVHSMPNQQLSVLLAGFRQLSWLAIEECEDLSSLSILDCCHTLRDVFLKGKAINETSKTEAEKILKMKIISLYSPQEGLHLQLSSKTI